jgi:hypothetical protein
MTFLAVSVGLIPDDALAAVTPYMVIAGMEKKSLEAVLLTVKAEIVGAVNVVPFG